MMFKEFIKRSPRVMFGPVVVSMALLSLACGNSGTTSTGTGATPNANMGTSASPAVNPAAAPQPAAPVALEAREPERYSVTTTITVQPTGNAPKANIPPLQF